MKDWVKEKLRAIGDLYPASRLEKSKSRWRRIWAGQNPEDRYPFVFTPITFNYYDDVFQKEEGLKAYLEEFIHRGRVQDDFIPAFFPGCKQSTLPSMFGAREIRSGNDYSCDKLIFDHHDIDDLPEPSMAPGTVAHEWLSIQEYYLQETEGQIPVHVADMQGPLDVGGKLWGYDNMFSAPYEDPGHFHQLMGKITDAFILFWNRQQELLGDLFIGTHLFAWDWVPESAGASLSADSMALISPDFFEQHYKAYLNKIGRAFGGLSVHSCGDFSAVVKNLCAMPQVKAVNAGQMTAEQLLQAGFDSTKVFIAYERIDTVGALFDRVRSQPLRPSISISGLWPSADRKVIHPDCWSASDWKRIEDRVARVQNEACVR